MLSRWRGSNRCHGLYRLLCSRGHSAAAGSVTIRQQDRWIRFATPGGNHLAMFVATISP